MHDRFPKAQRWHRTTEALERSLRHRPHEYLSTACRHELHDLCRGRCWWCKARCLCRCHRSE